MSNIEIQKIERHVTQVRSRKLLKVSVVTEAGRGNERGGGCSGALQRPLNQGLSTRSGDRR